MQADAYNNNAGTCALDSRLQGHQVKSVGCKELHRAALLGHVGARTAKKVVLGPTQS